MWWCFRNPSFDIYWSHTFIWFKFWWYKVTTALMASVALGNMQVYGIPTQVWRIVLYIAVGHRHIRFILYNLEQWFSASIWSLIRKDQLTLFTIYTFFYFVRLAQLDPSNSILTLKSYNYRNYLLFRFFY